MSAKTAVLDTKVEAVRGFNRFYTQQIGVLQEGLLHSRFSLTELRVLYELAHWNDASRRPHPLPTASALAMRLALDEGYLSRILRGFMRDGLVRRERIAGDGRTRALLLTAKGRRAFAPLEERSRDEVRSLLSRLEASEQAGLVASMQSIETLLRAPKPRRDGYVLRMHRPGDIGWVVHRHGVLYAEEYGYDQRFEALVADIAAKFVLNFDAERERCWIAERGGQVLGSVFVVKSARTIAKLRLLLVEPHARGMGLGRRLVGECIAFARAAGYRKIVLWTQSELLAARTLYEQAGFSCVDSQPHRSFGRDLVAETWSLDLCRREAHRR